MWEIEFEMTDQEFEDYILEEIGKTRDDFTTPLLEDKKFILEAIKNFGELCDEVVGRIPSKLLGDEEIWEAIYRHDPDGMLEYYGDLMPINLWMNPRFIAVLAEYNSRIIEEAPEEGKDEYTIYTAIEAIEDNYETWQYVNEFMYIATHVPSKLWEKEDFVYHMICYGFEWLYDDKEKAKEFFDMISKKLWNNKDFVLEILEDGIIYSFDFISDYISNELKQDDEIKELLNKDEE